MNKEYDKNIGLTDECFDSMRSNADVVLQRLIANMVEKGSYAGTMTIKIDVEFLTEFIDDYDQYGEPCGGHDALKPVFRHKISSVMQIKDDKRGQSYSKLLELHYDDETGKYILVPIKGAQQMNLFEAQNEEEQENDGAALKPLPENAYVLPEAADHEFEELIDDLDNSDFKAFDSNLSDYMEMPESYDYEEPIDFVSNSTQE